MNDLISRKQAIDALESIGSLDTETDRQYARTVFENLPLAQQWIPCSERLPEDEYVLISKAPTKISGDKWSVAIAIRTADPRSRKIQWRDTGFGVIPDDKVLAWMPLPEPFKAERREDG